MYVYCSTIVLLAKAVCLATLIHPFTKKQVLCGFIGGESAFLQTDLFPQTVVPAQVPHREFH